uniref:Uncharacterized protein n=1 Tax=biofilter metagenome TaxID=1070537 RepID=A0A1A7GDL6_9ZZZZ
MLTQAEANALVPPLRGCALCVHSTPCNGELLCDHPRIALNHAPKLVRLARDIGGECGPSAVHMHMISWEVRS